MEDSMMEPNAPKDVNLTDMQKRLSQIHSRVNQLFQRLEYINKGPVTSKDMVDQDSKAVVNPNFHKGRMNAVIADLEYQVAACHNEVEKLLYGTTNGQTIKKTIEESHRTTL